MKKFFLVFALALFLVFPLQVHAGSFVGAGILGAIFAQDAVEYAIEAVYYAKDIIEAVQSTMALKEQVEHWVRNEKRYLDNLRSIMDVRSFDDFMGWFNRSMYISRESERIYSDMGVRVGGKYYDLTEIDEIPGNIRNDYIDRHWGDFSEEEKYKAYTKLGLAPSNYMYLKTWQGRNEEIKKRLLTSREMHADEMEEAADRNHSLLSDYSTSRDDIDSNTIAKNSGASLAHIEMQLRELGLTMDDFMAYVVTRDNEDKLLPNAMVPSENWGRSPYRPIADGSAKDSFRD